MLRTNVWMIVLNKQDITIYLPFTYIHHSGTVTDNEIQFNTDQVIGIVRGKPLLNKYDRVVNSL